MRGDRLTHIQPMTRPVYVIIREVPRPTISTTAIIRTPDATTLQIHPGADVPTAAADINNLLNGEEYPNWVLPYLGTDPTTLARFRASPKTNIPTHVLHTPILAPYIPHLLRAPGVIYT